MLEADVVGLGFGVGGGVDDAAERREVEGRVQVME